MMEQVLLSNNFNFFGYGILIGCGLTLGCSVYYLLISNNTGNIPNNTEPLTNQQIETISKDNLVPDSNTEDFITDSDFETDPGSDYLSEHDSDSTDAFEEIFNNPDLYWVPPFESKFKNVEFIMPDVDFNVCPIEELKLYEFCALFGKEMAEHSVSEEEMMELISLFSEKELATNWINDLLLAIIDLL
jgi:hypothetical protein